MNNLQKQVTTDEIEKKLCKAFENIGRKFYEESKNSESSTYKELFQEVKTLFEEKNNAERKKLASQGMRRCETCQHIVTIDSIFCNRCGTKLDKLEITELNMIDRVRTCKNCGFTLEDDATFCPNCGKRQ